MSPLSVLTELLASADFLRALLAPLADPDPREADVLFGLVAEDADAEPAARAVLRALDEAGFSVR